ncbi:MAG: T9SS type A sorting domain-containing protein [Flavobacteriales bacterium]
MDNKVSIKTQLDEALINVTPDLVGGELVIINMAGQEVKSQVIGDVNAKITYEGLETGIYTLVARFEAGSVTKKIYVR